MYKALFFKIDNEERRFRVMPTKKSRNERPRRPGAGPALTERPASRPTSPNVVPPLIRPTNPGNNRPQPKGPPPGKGVNWRNIRENLGWSLVIGLPIILVVLAILWRATNGFQGNPSDKPLPTIAPTATAGAFLAPPALPGGASRNRLLYYQALSPNEPAQLFSANTDGKEVVQLTNTAEIKSTPVWSPDGKQIAFAADGVGIQAVNYDGSGLHTIAYSGFAPVWSPDGSKLAFLKQEPATDGRGPDNTGLVRFLYVTNTTAKPGEEKQLAYDALGPNWSPDSKDIAFFSLRNAVMFTIPATGGQPTQIKTDGLAGWFPTFGPDGISLAFYGAKSAAQFVQSLDFGSLTPIPTLTGPAATATSLATATAASSAAASPGTPGSTASVAATPVPLAITGLYKINRDGSGLSRLLEIENPPADYKGNNPRFGTYIQAAAEASGLLANRPSFKVAPVFSPDGKLVASLLAGLSRDTAGISLVPTDGTAPVNLVSGENGLEAGTRLNPSFSSEGNRLYYWFQASAKDSKKVIRYYDLTTKKEETAIANGDSSFTSCCGYRK